MVTATASFYDAGMAARLVRGAAAAYGDDGEMAAWARAQGCDACEVVRDAGTDTLGFVAAAAERAFVVFRGTRDLRNWITDLDCRRVKMELRIADCGLRIEVHEGFQRALAGVWDSLLSILESLAPGKRDVFFCGHSLGGALAMLAAARWESGPGRAALPRSPDPIPEAAQQRGPTIWLYTFGQPRVGNAAWRKCYDAALRPRSFRIVHAGDVVARVPWLLGMFRHAGTEIFYDALGVNHVDWPAWAKAPGDAAGLFKEWRHGRLALLADHHVGAYEALLEAEGEMESIARRSSSAGTSEMENGI